MIRKYRSPLSGFLTDLYLKMKLIVAVGGASGAIYTQRLFFHLSRLHNQVERVGVVLSTNAIVNWELEVGPWNSKDYPFDFYEPQDYHAPFASGSAQYGVMLVCPCSMGLLGRIASGVSNDLTTRAADVILKERRRLILLTRETPLSLIHIRNMKEVTEAGAIVCPAVPSFYHKPTTIAEVVDTVVFRALDMAGFQLDIARWGD